MKSALQKYLYTKIFFLIDFVTLQTHVMKWGFVDGGPKRRQEPGRWIIFNILLKILENKNLQRLMELKQKHKS